MEPNKDVQIEDSPAVEKPVTETKKSEPAKKSFGSKVLPWLLVALIFLIGGAAVVYFTLYQPAVDATTAANAALETAKADVITANGNTAAVQSQLDTANADLTSVRTMLDEKVIELAKANQLALIYKFQSDVNAARLALNRLDVNSARQALNFAKADLVELETTDVDANALAGFSSQLGEAEANLTEPELFKSQDALETVYNNLLLLINNLK